MLESKSVKLLGSDLMASQFLFKFWIILYCLTHNSPLVFKLICFLLCIKGPNESSNFETFVCSGENVSNSSCHFPNHMSVFLQILHHTLVSWNITPLYIFLAQTLYNLVKSSRLKCKFLILKCKIPYVNFETTSQFLFRFLINLQCYYT